MNKTLFVLRKLVISCLPMIAVFAFVLLLNIIVYKNSLVEAIRYNTITILLGLPLIETISLFAAHKKANKIGVDIWDKKNKKGDLTHTIELSSRQADIIDSLKDGGWKYKIVETKNEKKQTILTLKHHQWPGGFLLDIIVKEHEGNKVRVIFKTSSFKKYWWTLTFSNWTMQLKQIEYFQNIILLQEDLNRNLNFID